MRNSFFFVLLFSLLVASCGTQEVSTQPDVLQADVVTSKVPHDSDDPAIWINPADPANSLIVGTDKDADGGLYVFNLQGERIDSLCIKGLQRPNNVDIEYGLNLGGKPTDIAVTTERFTHKLRIYSLPDMKPVDGGGLPVFEGETAEGYRDLMGIALFKVPGTDSIYAIVGRKTGPKDSSYLWQYLLHDNGKGQVAATLVRKFGAYSGKKEIESIMIDDALGYVYYSDEGVGVRKYYAHPSKGNTQLALFATTGFTQDHEGISLYTTRNTTGFILVSDQGANQFHIFPREGDSGNPNAHSLLRVVKVAAIESDGSDATSTPLGKEFPRGIFVAMSTDSTFHFYKAERILGDSILNRK